MISRGGKSPTTKEKQMDYLEVDKYGRTFPAKRRRISDAGSGIKIMKKVDTTKRFCDCGKQMSVYNKETTCFACAEKKSQR
jgi:hypothetical protein